MHTFCWHPGIIKKWVLQSIKLLWVQTFRIVTDRKKNHFIWLNYFNTKARFLIKGLKYSQGLQNIMMKILSQPLHDGVLLLKYQSQPTVTIITTPPGLWGNDKRLVTVAEGARGTERHALSQWDWQRGHGPGFV